MSDPKRVRGGESSLKPAGDDPGTGTAFVAVAILHFICCGLPLLLLSGVSLAFLAPYWPIAAGVLALLGVIGFLWYFKRGCATCPRNEGRCRMHQEY